MIIDKEEVKFKIKEFWTETRITLLYYAKEPFLEIKRIIGGYYNSHILFWMSFIVLVYFWINKIGGWRVKAAIIILILSHIYMFYKSGTPKNYYEKEMVKGEK